MEADQDDTFMLLSLLWIEAEDDDNDSTYLFTDIGTIKLPIAASHSCLLPLHTWHKLQNKKSNF